MASQQLTVKEISEGAERQGSIFVDHPQRLFASLVQDADLSDSVRAVLRGDPCPSSESFYRLRGAGTLTGEDPGNARLRCALYQTFLAGRLSVNPS